MDKTTCCSCRRDPGLAPTTVRQHSEASEGVRGRAVGSPRMLTWVFLFLPVGVQSHDLYCHRVSGNRATTPPRRPHLMSLHVFLDIRFLGKGTATRDALEGLFPGVAVGTRLQSILVYRQGCGLHPGAHSHQEGPETPLAIISTPGRPALPVWQRDQR